MAVGVIAGTWPRSLSSLSPSTMVSVPAGSSRLRLLESPSPDLGLSPHVGDSRGAPPTSSHKPVFRTTASRRGDVSPWGGHDAVARPWLSRPPSLCVMAQEHGVSGSGPSVA